jgi:hypothetical protein
VSVCDRFVQPAAPVGVVYRLDVEALNTTAVPASAQVGHHITTGLRAAHASVGNYMSYRIMGEAQGADQLEVETA